MGLDVASNPQKLASWWSGVRFAFEQVLPQLISNSNEAVDGTIRLARYRPLDTAPTDAEEGWVAFADGTNWNPGSGAGLYEYRGGTWNKL